MSVRSDVVKADPGWFAVEIDEPAKGTVILHPIVAWRIDTVIDKWDQPTCSYAYPVNTSDGGDHSGVIRDPNGHYWKSGRGPFTREEICRRDLEES